ncbi:MAG: hypothetical protein RLZ10_597 [Bacteroidota bacterium]|jgi:hypothetical protein
MSEKEIEKIENTIVQARKEGLLKMSDTSMQSHGKLWGMDVFSWINPKPNVLSATMGSFPFPIIWIASYQERDEVLQLNIDLTEKIHYTILLENEFELDSDFSSNDFSIVLTISEAFTRIEKMKIRPSILLFSYSKSDWEFQKKQFNDYLTLLQVK